MSEHDLGSQLVDWIVNMFLPTAEPTPTRDYYLVLLRQGHGVPEAVRLAVDNLLEEVRAAVAREESYNPRAHRGRLALPSHIEFSAHRLPRPALVRRIVVERITEAGPPPPRRNDAARPRSDRK